MSQFYVSHCGGGYGYGVYDRNGGSSPLASGIGSEEDASAIAEAMNGHACLKSELAAKSAECREHEYKYHELEKHAWGTSMIVDDLRAKLAASEAGAAGLREALEVLKKAEWMVTHDWGGDREAVMNQVDAALATNAGAAWLEKYRAMERVCEAWLAHTPDVMTDEIKADLDRRWNEFFDAIDDYRALCAKEPK
jgi:hypothetical protein